VSVGLYLDVHVPATIARGFVLRGVDVLTAQPVIQMLIQQT
jgi:hypothetical protein